MRAAGVAAIAAVVLLLFVDASVSQARRQSGNVGAPRVDEANTCAAGHMVNGQCMDSRSLTASLRELDQLQHLIDKKRAAIKSLLSDGSEADDALDSQGSVFLLGSTAADGFDAADYPDGTELPNQVSFPEKATCMAFLPYHITVGGGYLVVGDVAGGLQFRTRNGTLLNRLEVSRGRIQAIAPVSTVTADGSVAVLDDQGVVSLVAFQSPPVRRYRPPKKLPRPTSQIMAPLIPWEPVPRISARVQNLVGATRVISVARGRAIYFAVSFKNGSIVLLAGATLNISVPIAAWPPAPVERRSAQSQRNDTNSSDQSLKGSDRRAPGSYIPREGSSLGSIYSVSAVPPTGLALGTDSGLRFADLRSRRVLPPSCTVRNVVPTGSKADNADIVREQMQPMNASVVAVAVHPNGLSAATVERGGILRLFNLRVDRGRIRCNSVASSALSAAIQAPSDVAITHYTAGWAVLVGDVLTLYNGSNANPLFPVLSTRIPKTRRSSFFSSDAAGMIAVTSDSSGRLLVAHGATGEALFTHININSDFARSQDGSLSWLASVGARPIAMICGLFFFLWKFKGGRGPRSRGKLSRAGFPPSSRHNSRYGRGLDEDEFTESGISEVAEEITGLQRRLRG